MFFIWIMVSFFAFSASSPQHRLQRCSQVILMVPALGHMPEETYTLRTKTVFLKSWKQIKSDSKKRLVTRKVQTSEPCDTCKLDVGFFLFLAACVTSSTFVIIFLHTAFLFDGSISSSNFWSIFVPAQLPLTKEILTVI